MLTCHKSDSKVFIKLKKRKFSISKLNRNTIYYNHKTIKYILLKYKFKIILIVIYLEVILNIMYIN
jgi:hypothetical protein